MDLENISAYLLEHGFLMTSLELLAECREKYISPPADLMEHFSNPGRFEDIPRSRSSITDGKCEAGPSPDLSFSSSKSPEPNESDTESVDLAQEESKGLLRFQLRAANEEIRRLKHAITETSSETVTKSDSGRISTSNLDNAIFEYLERKGYQYSASTMVDEAQIDQTKKCNKPIEDMIVTSTTPTYKANEDNALELEKLRREVKRFNSIETELKKAKAEINRFSYSLVSNIIDNPIETIPHNTENEFANDGSTNSSHPENFVEDKLFKMVLEDRNLSSDIDDNMVASNLEELLAVIENTIEPLLSGILLKHRSHLIPLLLSSSLLSKGYKSKEVLLRNLFNLIKKPDEEQRDLIAQGCALYSKRSGDIRCEAELLPQLWLQIEHKHQERRMLVAETAGTLALTVGPSVRPLLISICQQLMSDRETEVRDAASKSLSILICFCNDNEKLSKLVDSCLDVILDERVPVDSGLLLLSLLANISFKLGTENVLVHKLLQLLEKEYDNKRVIRSLAEIIPHFFVNIILSLEAKSDDSESRHSIHTLNISYISKWNQISNIVDDHRLNIFSNNYKIFMSMDWEDYDQCGERCNIIISFLVKQVIRRLIDCCNESPAMPDFCLSWFKLFRLFPTLFPLNFVLKIIQPMIVFELGLFSNTYNFNNLLLPCYAGAIIGPLVNLSNECREHFSLSVREALMFFGTRNVQSSIFELTTEMVMDRNWFQDAAVTKMITSSMIGVLWEGVTHENFEVRTVTVRALTCATKSLGISEISSQLFPPINSFVNDENAAVRCETAKTIAILQQRLQAEPEADLEKRIQKLILQLMVDTSSSVVEGIIRAMIPIVIDHNNAFREDFFLPQIAMMMNSLTIKSDVKLIEIILDFYDALLSSCCVMSQSCYIQSVIPSLQYLITITKTACAHRHIQAQSLLRQSQCKVSATKKESTTPTETKFSLTNTIRNPFTKKK